MLALLGGDRSHGAVWHWVHRLADSVADPPAAQPWRVAVDETAVRIRGEQSWAYTTIVLDSEVLLDSAVFGRCGTEPVAAFLHGLTQKQECPQAECLVDGADYLTAISWIDLSCQLDYHD